MNAIQFYGLLPFMVLAVASILVILLIAFRQSHTVIQVAGFLMMCLVIAAMWYVRDRLPVVIAPLFIVDGYAALFTGLIVFSVLIVGLLSYIYFEEREENPKGILYPAFFKHTGCSHINHKQSFYFLFHRAGIIKCQPLCADRLPAYPK